MTKKNISKKSDDKRKKLISFANDLLTLRSNRYQIYLSYDEIAKLTKKSKNDPRRACTRDEWDEIVKVEEKIKSKRREIELIEMKENVLDTAEKMYIGNFLDKHFGEDDYSYVHHYHDRLLELIGNEKEYGWPFIINDDEDIESSDILKNIDELLSDRNYKYKSQEKSSFRRHLSSVLGNLISHLGELVVILFVLAVPNSKFESLVIAFLLYGIISIRIYAISDGASRLGMINMFIAEWSDLRKNLHSPFEKHEIDDIEDVYKIREKAELINLYNMFAYGIFILILYVYVIYTLL